MSSPSLAFDLPRDPDVYAENLLKFSQASLAWCEAESEKAAGMVMETLEFLVEDAKRIAAISDEAVKALAAFRENLNDIRSNKSGSIARELAARLNELKSSHLEVAELVDPIIKTLQYQDRVTQNMANLLRMVKVWQEKRNDPNTNIDTLGQELVKMTTMTEERKIIKKFFPNVDVNLKDNSNSFLF